MNFKEGGKKGATGKQTGVEELNSCRGVITGRKRGLSETGFIEEDLCVENMDLDVAYFLISLRKSVQQRKTNTSYVKPEAVSLSYLGFQRRVF